MNDYFLYHPAQERQAEFRREAEMNRKARQAETSKPNRVRRMLSTSSIFIILVIVLVRFLLV